MRLARNPAVRRLRHRLRRSRRRYLFWTVGGAFLMAWAVATGQWMYPIAIAGATLLAALLAPSARRTFRPARLRRLAKSRPRRAA